MSGDATEASRRSDLSEGGTLQEPKFDLPADAKMLGVARCSESEPFCTAVGRRPNGDVVLANHLGAQLVIPAAEVHDVFVLLSTIS
jgi:hypothetical protein